MSIFKVELKKVVDDSYEIETGFSLEKKIVQDIQDGLVGNIQKFAIITDSIVRDLYAQPICEQMVKAGYQAEIFSFPAGEKSKTRATKEMVEDAMLAHGYRRDCCIIAVGGGVVTDLAGFVAGTFGRGIPFINYATTLLAAADASVGGKTAVYISHRLSSCRFCDRIIVFDGGTIIEDGSHDKLMENTNGFYFNMYNTQAKHYQN